VVEWLVEYLLLGVIKQESGRDRDCGCARFVAADVFRGVYVALRLNFFSVKSCLLYYSLHQERVMSFCPRA